MEENLKADEKINGDDQIKAEESTPTMTEPKKETLEELELSKTNNQLTKKLAMFENTLKSVQNDIVIPLKERITRLELEKKGSHFYFLSSKCFIYKPKTTKSPSNFARKPFGPILTDIAFGPAMMSARK